MHKIEPCMSIPRLQYVVDDATYNHMLYMYAHIAVCITPYYGRLGNFHFKNILCKIKFFMVLSDPQTFVMVNGRVPGVFLAFSLLQGIGKVRYC